MNDELPILVEVRRGAIVESVHRGAVCIVEPDGRIIARLGNGALVTSTRSTIKPIQAIPLITSGAADHFNITSRELAVACASHDGEPIHTNAVAGILGRIGLDEGALMCGAHAPYNEDAARRLDAFNQLHNNCSGKHAAMLATAVHSKLPIEDYVSPDHPVQQKIISTFAQMAGLDGHLPTAIDGCSAPTFGVPLLALATASARLVNPWGTAGSDLREAAKRIVAAMTSHPEMVGGTKNRIDTDLMRVARGKLICKVGAEAVYSIGILPCDLFPRGLGIAIKMEDGSYRGLGAVIIETLAQIGALDRRQQSRLAQYHRPAIRNRRNLKVGEVCPVFDLGFDNKSI